jgi:O-antigen ligase
MDLKIEGRIPRPYRDFVWLLVLSGSVVFMEPAPYDLAFIALFFAGLVSSHLEFPRHTVLPTFLLLIFVEANLASMFFATRDPQIASKYFLITFYLVLSWVFFCGLLNKYNEHASALLLSGYLASALFAATIGILAYLGVIPDFGLIIRLSGRLTGFFKDPNVFGPYLVAPALLSLNRLERENRAGPTAGWTGAFVLLCAGVFLSFSRAAWGNLVVALAAYAVLPSGVALKRRLRALVLVSMIVLPVALGLLTIPKVTALTVGRFGLQGYDISRFDTHKKAFLLAWSKPLGLGPAQSDIEFGMSPHSLYVRVLSEYGLLGAISLLWLLIGTAWRALSAVFCRHRRPASYSSVIAASLLGILVNSAVIDTLHWRHLWLLLAFPWVSTSNKGENHE